ncbi:MAG: hypothetical protein HYS41_05340 [Candidatus Omnitrophica bacterium]|nr:hypothetical protein [Candidatus Omnitrophota bacterium]
MALPGCATLASQPILSSHRLELPVKPEAAWQAIHAVLGKTPLRSVDRAQGVIQTGWVEGWGDRRFGLMGGSWHRRYRLTISLKPLEGGSQVAVASQQEEKAPAGRLALRWRRVPSDGSVETDFLNRLKAQAGSSS